MIKVIITTTIHPVLPAINMFDALEGWELIVVGDRKTPSSYQLKRGTFLDYRYQAAEYPELCEIMGPDSVDRGRNIGFIEAWRRGADVIATIDDDNIPLFNWGNDIVVNQEVESNHFIMPANVPVFDPLWPTAERVLWHRGFPLQLLQSRRESRLMGNKKINCKVQANLWNGDPDIDAICRFAYNPKDIVFDVTNGRGGFSGYWSCDRFSPFNTQNTMISGKYIKDYISIPFIGRMDDIWGAYLFEHHNPESVVYGEPTVFSDRSPHDTTDDMKLEILGYLKTLEFCQRLDRGGEKEAFELLPARSVEAIHAYRECFND